MDGNWMGNYWRNFSAFWGLFIMIMVMMMIGNDVSM